MPMMHHALRECGPRPLYFTINSNTANVDLFSLAGSPGGIVTVTLTIASNKLIYSNSATAALTVSGFAVGSVITIINNGTVAGKRGAGGVGATNFGNAGAGTDGGPAINLGNNVTIDNTYGNIFGGGGGGGGGGFSSGAGTGGDGGSGAGVGSGTLKSKTNGAAGTVGGFGLRGGDGGNGGDYGGGGQHGHSSDSGDAGGAQGHGANAIILNGKTVTWLGGNNATQVKGDVS